MTRKEKAERAVESIKAQIVDATLRGLALERQRKRLLQEVVELDKAQQTLGRSLAELEADLRVQFDILVEDDADKQGKEVPS